MTLAFSYLRYSSTEQKKGDSVRRQKALREAWLQRNPGVTLDTSLVLEDRGVSAFRGKNAETGQLKAFRDEVESGRVPPGSYLLVENLDRLSRDEIEKALAVFLEIIGAGVVIVTFKPEYEFRRGANPVQIILALTEFMRGNSESVAKSARAKERWNDRRAKVKSEPMTAKLPGWIVAAGRKKDERGRVVEAGKLVLDHGKAATVKRMFELCLQGWGCAAIATKLNQEGIPPFSKNAKVWRGCTVYAALTDRACVGEFTPMTKGSDGKRIPVADTVKDYFPPVIDEGTFALAQEAIASRSGEKAGTQDGGWTCTNIFRGLVQTEEGRAYHYAKSINRLGQEHFYLVLRNTDGKPSPNIPYSPFEEMMLLWLERDVKIDLSKGEVDLESLKARKADLERRMEEAADIITGQGLEGKAKELVGKRLKDMSEEHKVLIKKIETAKIPPQDHTANTRTAIRLLREEDTEASRRLVKQQLQAVLKRVVVENITGTGRVRSYRCRVELADGGIHTITYKANPREILDVLIEMEETEAVRQLMLTDGKLTEKDAKEKLRHLVDLDNKG
jgi:DNA invertase Pin-like site-specific DNA recombinase